MKTDKIRENTTKIRLTAERMSETAETLHRTFDLDALRELHVLIDRLDSQFSDLKKVTPKVRAE